MDNTPKKPNTKLERQRKRDKTTRERKKFAREVLKADGFQCQNPFVTEHNSVVDPHHILKKTYNEVKYGITLCRTCHEMVERQGGMVPQDGGSKRFQYHKQVNSLQYMIAILEWHFKNTKDSRWGGALEKLYDKREFQEGKGL